MAFWDGARWVDEPRRQTQIYRRPSVARAAKLSGLVALVIVALSVSVTSAAPGNHSVPSAIWLEQPAGTTALDSSWPALSDAVAFGATYPKNTKNPWVSLMCYQDGTLVYGAGGKVDQTFVLGGASSDWVRVGGGADCTAELGDLYWKGGYEYYTYLAQTAFTAAAP
jgi:hypothetical protein